MRRVLSTHLTRVFARRAQADYEQLQDDAKLHFDDPRGTLARSICAKLGIGLVSQIVVEQTTYEHGRWAVVVR